MNPLSKELESPPSIRDLDLLEGLGQASRLEAEIAIIEQRQINQRGVFGLLLLLQLRDDEVQKLSFRLNLLEKSLCSEPLLEDQVEPSFRNPFYNISDVDIVRIQKDVEHNLYCHIDHNQRSSHMHDDDHVEIRLDGWDSTWDSHHISSLSSSGIEGPEPSRSFMLEDDNQSLLLDNLRNENSSLKDQLESYVKRCHELSILKVSLADVSSAAMQAELRAEEIEREHDASYAALYSALMSSKSSADADNEDQFIVNLTEELRVKDDIISDLQSQLGQTNVDKERYDKQESYECGSLSESIVNLQCNLAKERIVRAMPLNPIIEEKSDFEESILTIDPDLFRSHLSLASRRPTTRHLADAIEEPSPTFDIVDTSNRRSNRKSVLFSDTDPSILNDLANHVSDLERHAKTLRSDINDTRRYESDPDFALENDLINSLYSALDRLSISLDQVLSTGVLPSEVTDDELRSIEEAALKRAKQKRAGHNQAEYEKMMRLTAIVQNLVAVRNIARKSGVVISGNDQRKLDGPIVNSNDTTLSVNEDLADLAVALDAVPMSANFNPRIAAFSSSPRSSMPLVSEDLPELALALNNSPIKRSKSMSLNNSSTPPSKIRLVVNSDLAGVASALNSVTIHKPAASSSFIINDGKASPSLDSPVSSLLSSVENFDIARKSHRLRSTSAFSVSDSDVFDPLFSLENALNNYSTAVVSLNIANAAMSESEKAPFEESRSNTLEKDSVIKESVVSMSRKTILLSSLRPLPTSCGSSVLDAINCVVELGSCHVSMLCKLISVSKVLRNHIGRGRAWQYLDCSNSISLDGPALTVLAGYSSNFGLAMLNVTNCRKVSSVSLSNVLLLSHVMKNLRLLNLSGCSQLDGQQTGSAIAQCNSLERLDLSSCWKLVEVLPSYLNLLINLKEVVISNCHVDDNSLLNIPVSLENLTGHNLTAVSGSLDLSGLISCSKRLKSLSLSFSSDIPALELRSLSQCAALEKLSLRNCRVFRARHLKFLSGLGSLRQLTLSSVWSMEDLIPLRNIVSLTQILIHVETPVQDVTSFE